jgi:hypothetical protein
MNPNPESAHSAGRLWWIAVRKERGRQLGEGIDTREMTCSLCLQPRESRVRALHSRLGEEAAWNTYIAHLREDHRRLRALREELDIAGL